MWHDHVAIGPEHAFARAKEIMDDIEESARSQLGGPQFATMGPWKIPRDVANGYVRAMLYECILVGPALDDAIYQLLQSLSNVRVRPFVVEIEPRPRDALASSPRLRDAPADDFLPFEL